MTVGERIRAARKAKGLTQKALAEACGIAEPTIRRYELGKLNPKYETLEKIARALDTSASELRGIGFLPLELLLEKNREREQVLKGLEKEPGLDSDLSDIENPLRRLFQSDVPNEVLEAFGDIESLSAIQRCLQELGFREMSGPEPDNGTVALINRRTRLVYILDYDRYLDMLEAVLRNTKQEIALLLDSACEALSYEEAQRCGYDDLSFLLPRQELFAPEAPQEGPTEPDKHT